MPSQNQKRPRDPCPDAHIVLSPGEEWTMQFANVLQKGLGE